MLSLFHLHQTTGVLSYIIYLTYLYIFIAGGGFCSVRDENTTFFFFSFLFFIYRRRSDEGNGQYDGKRQRFQSPQQPSPVIHQAVPLRDDLRHHFPGSVGLPLRLAPPSHELNGQVSTPGDAWLFDLIDTTLPVAKDKVFMTSYFLLQ